MTGGPRTAAPCGRRARLSGHLGKTLRVSDAFADQLARHLIRPAALPDVAARSPWSVGGRPLPGSARMPRCGRCRAAPQRWRRRRRAAGGRRCRSCGPSWWPPCVRRCEGPPSGPWLPPRLPSRLPAPRPSARRCLDRCRRVAVTSGRSPGDGRCPSERVGRCIASGSFSRSTVACTGRQILRRGQHAVGATVLVICTR